MKRFKLLTTLLVVALCVGFSSCNKNSLVNTTWSGNHEGETITFVFSTENSGTMIFECDGFGTKTVLFSYVLNAPKITFIIDGDRVNGEIQGNMMILDADGDVLVVRRNP